MFQHAREESLNSIQWKPGNLDYLETWVPEHHQISETESLVSYGTLQPQELSQWLKSKDASARSDGENPHPQPNGGIRMLFCESTLFPRPSISMSREAYCAIESEFALHPSTLHAFEVQGGACAKHIEYSKSEPERVIRISIIFKAPQKQEIINYLLSLTFDVLSRRTSAIIIGECVTSDLSDEKKTSDGNSPVTTLRNLLKHSSHIWSDPLLLPCTLVQDHLIRTRSFIFGSLTANAMQIEDTVGVVNEGRRNYKILPDTAFKAAVHAAEIVNQGQSFERSESTELTIRISNQMTKVFFSQRSPEWNLEATKFLLELDRALNKLGIKRPREANEFSELLGYHTSLATATNSHVQMLQVRLRLQLDVLYSFVAQTDNHLNARLAATTGRDSTSMKILAFITTLFLPATFVATLFSMSMFDWQHGPQSDTLGVVSFRFWIYWAVSVPLTLLTLSGWALWWSFEKRRWSLGAM